MGGFDAQYILSNYRDYLTEHVARKYLFLTEVFNVLAYGGELQIFPESFYSVLLGLAFFHSHYELTSWMLWILLAFIIYYMQGLQYSVTQVDQCTFH